MILGQPNHIKTFIYQFINEIKELNKNDTPAPVGQIIIPPQKDGLVLNIQMKEKFMSGVGIILYLTIITRPDLYNVNRELLNVKKRATLGHFKPLVCCIKYLDGTDNSGVELRVNRHTKEVEMKDYVDIYWSGTQYTGRVS